MKETGRTRRPQDDVCVQLNQQTVHRNAVQPSPFPSFLRSPPEQRLLLWGQMPSRKAAVNERMTTGSETVSHFSRVHRRRQTQAGQKRTEEVCFLSPSQEVTAAQPNAQRKRETETVNQRSTKRQKLTRADALRLSGHVYLTQVGREESSRRGQFSRREGNLHCVTVKTPPCLSPWNQGIWREPLFVRGRRS